MQCAFVWLEMLNGRPHHLIWWVGNHVAEALKTKHKSNTTSCILYQTLIYRLNALSYTIPLSSPIESLYPEDVRTWVRVITRDPPVTSQNRISLWVFPVWVEMAQYSVIIDETHSDPPHLGQDSEFI